MKKLKLSNIITKILLSTIFVLASLIYINKSEDNKNKYLKFVFKETLKFNEINNYLNGLVDKKLLFVKNKVQPVMAQPSEEITYFDKGTKFKYSQNTPVKTIESGIVVSIGQEEYGQTVVVQGIDGFDIWYSNIDNIDITIYDYINKDTIIGSTNELIMLIKKDGEYISYEEYLKLI